MSLYTTALARQTYQLFGKGIFQRQLRLVPAAKWVTTTSCARADLLKQGEDFWDKNKRLNRPMSPHLTIYKIQITSLLSITHRGTGLAQSAIMSGFAIAMLILPGTFPHYLGVIQCMHFGGALIFLTKYALAWPFLFHLFNGIRHLAWDLGKGFLIKDVNMTGWAVVGLSTIFAAIAAAM